jgi:hypothetical protein
MKVKADFDEFYELKRYFLVPRKLRHLQDADKYKFADIEPLKPTRVKRVRVRNQTDREIRREFLRKIFDFHKKQGKVFLQQPAKEVKPKAYVPLNTSEYNSTVEQLSKQNQSIMDILRAGMYKDLPEPEV